MSFNAEKRNKEAPVGPALRAGRVDAIVSIASGGTDSSLSDAFETNASTGKDGSAPSSPRRVKLGEVCALSKGVQIDGKDLSDYFAIPFLNGGINPSGRWKEANVEANSIAISEGGNSCGYVNYMATPFWCGAHCYYLYDLKCDSKYLYHALKAKQKEIMSLRTGVCMPNIKKSSMSEFAFLYHDSLPEQRAIATELDRICELKRTAEKLVEKYQQLVKSRFVEMFGEERATCVLSEETELITKGTTPTSIGFKFENTGVNFVKIETFSDDGSLIAPKVAHISDECNNAMKRSQLRAGDLLFSIAGAIGRVAVVPPEILPANTNQALAIVRLKKDSSLIVPYLVHALKSDVVVRQYLGMKQGVAQLNISLKNIGDFKIPLPPLSLQREFAAFVAQVDKLEFAAKRAMEKLDLLYRSKLQEHFG